MIKHPYLFDSDLLDFWNTEINDILLIINYIGAILENAHMVKLCIWPFNLEDLLV